MRRGFTLFELSICLSVLALLSPVVYALLRGHEDRAAIARWRLECADGARAAAEELRLDARRGRALREGDAVGFAWAGCEVSYAVNAEGALLREASPACGGARALARRVESIAWAPGGVELTFARALRPAITHRDVVFLPVVSPGAP